MEKYTPRAYSFGGTAALNVDSVVLLKNAYKRRLLKINEDIRKCRKENRETKTLNAKRKIVNRQFNLLDQMQKKFNPECVGQKNAYFKLLDLYKND
ncbi:MAG: hypothetical protein LLG05_08405 [Porphyromonadaceae bacterium]|nr:hypothetical protein [Porphyromonadaceae bacterium]